MSRVLPNKFMAKSSQLGVESFKQVTTERVELQSVNGSSTVYDPRNGLSKITFKLPAYSASFMDTSRSFLSFNLKTNATSGIDTNPLKLSTGLNIFNRYTIKSANGVILEDVSSFDVLNKLFTVCRSDSDHAIDEGVYKDSDCPVSVASKLSQSGIDYNFKFSSGILSKHLQSYLPLFMMDSSAYAFEIDLYMSNPLDVLRSIHSSADAINPSFALSNVVYNLCLLRMDNELASKFNKTALDTNDEILIPYTTYHVNQSSATNQNSTFSIFENCTNFKRIWSVFVKPYGSLDDSTVMPFSSSIDDADPENRIQSYNYRLGTKSLYNSPIEETTNNNKTLQYVKDSLWAGDKELMISKPVNDTETKNNFQNNMFFTTAQFTYSEAELKGVTEGISSATPVMMDVKFQGTPSSLTCINFAEVGYNLCIKNGSLTYQEMGGSQSVY